METLKPVLLTAAGCLVMHLLRYIELMGKLSPAKAKRLLSSFVFLAPLIAELAAVSITSLALSSTNADFKGAAAFFLGIGGRAALGQLRAVAVQKATDPLGLRNLGERPTLRDVSL